MDSGWVTAAFAVTGIIVTVLVVLFSDELVALRKRVEEKFKAWQAKRDKKRLKRDEDLTLLIKGYAKQPSRFTSDFLGAILQTPVPDALILFLGAFSLVLGFATLIEEDSELAPFLLGGGLGFWFFLFMLTVGRVRKFPRYHRMMVKFRDQLDRDEAKRQAKPKDPGPAPYFYWHNYLDKVYEPKPFVIPREIYLGVLDRQGRTEDAAKLLNEDGTPMEREPPEQQT